MHGRSSCRARGCMHCQQRRPLRTCGMCGPGGTAGVHGWGCRAAVQSVRDSISSHSCGDSGHCQMCVLDISIEQSEWPTRVSVTACCHRAALLGPLPAPAPAALPASLQWAATAMHNHGVRLHRRGDRGGACRALACAWYLACGVLAACSNGGGGEGIDAVHDAVKRCAALCQVVSADTVMEVVLCTAAVLDAWHPAWLAVHGGGWRQPSYRRAPTLAHGTPQYMTQNTLMHVQYANVDTRV